MDNNIRVVVDDALLRLGAYLGVEGFELDENGLIGFEFAEGIGCSMELPAGSDRIHFHAAVTRLPRGKGTAFLKRLLGRNLFKLGVPGAWLALDGDEVLLCTTVDGHVFDAEALPDILLALTEEVRTLRQTLVAPSRSAEPEPLQSISFIRA